MKEVQPCCLDLVLLNSASYKFLMVPLFYVGL